MTKREKITEIIDARLGIKYGCYEIQDERISPDEAIDIIFNGEVQLDLQTLEAFKTATNLDLYVYAHKGKLYVLLREPHHKLLQRYEGMFLEDKFDETNKGVATGKL